MQPRREFSLVVLWVYLQHHVYGVVSSETDGKFTRDKRYLVYPPPGDYAPSKVQVLVDARKNEGASSALTLYLDYIVKERLRAQSSPALRLKSTRFSFPPANRDRYHRSRLTRSTRGSPRLIPCRSREISPQIASPDLSGSRVKINEKSSRWRAIDGDRRLFESQQHPLDLISRGFNVDRC